MAKDVGDAIGAVIGHAAREVVDTVSANARKGSKKGQLPQLSGGKGMAAGAGLVALVPLAAKGAGKVMHGLRNGAGPLQAATDKVSGTVQDAVGKKVDDAGGVSGIAKEAGKGMLPFGGGGGDKDDKKSSGGGVGQGRRMPIQQAVDVAVPIKDAYEQWTQYEEWPKFMHRLDRVSQEDDTHLSFKTKIWGVSREFKAEIVDERPEERVKWRVTEGVSHTGVVTFHELAPRLTRVDVDIDVHPGSMIEKLGRGLRHAKRAVRGDLHRFKAHVEIEEDVESPQEDEQKQSSRASASGGSSRRASAASSSSGSSSSRSRGGGGRSAASRSGGGSGSKSGSGSRSASSASRGSTSRSASSRSASSRSGGSNGASASGKSSSSRGSSRSSSANGSSSSKSNGSGSSSGGTRRRAASSRS
jgi:uncharacterized membrane protein